MLETAENYFNILRKFLIVDSVSHQPHRLLSLRFIATESSSRTIKMEEKRERRKEKLKKHPSVNRTTPDFDTSCDSGIHLYSERAKKPFYGEDIRVKSLLLSTIVARRTVIRSLSPFFTGSRAFLPSTPAHKLIMRWMSRK